MNTNEILHTLRNPYGFSDPIIREVALAAADTIEKLSGQVKEAFKIIEEWGRDYQKLLDWAEKNGLDVTTYNK